MTNPFAILLVGVTLGLLLTAAGALLGSWLAYRQRNNISPLPNVKAAMVSVFTRRRGVPAKSKTNMPHIPPMRV